MLRRSTAFAPATVANVAVGFDVLGFALEGVGDRVDAEAVPSGAEPVTIGSIDGLVPDLPSDPRRNTAAVAARAVWEAARPPHGFRLSLHKGIPLGSGMGGSAASAVAAAVAANALLDRPLSREALLPCALAGEAAASGAPHADNVAPCLYGGMTAVLATEPPEVVPLPVPPGLRCVLVRPHLEIETRRARAVLPAQITLGQHVLQASRLAAVVAGLYRGDLALIRRALADLLVEPHRAPLIPGFADAKAAALQAGALGFGISGSGPSVFAWIDPVADASAVTAAMRGAFGAHGLAADAWTSTVGGPCARLV
ncbi:MAG TPA: homoserine kinase [Candidatus Polarisedimenticolaceae bacterium]|nr:homoserine kinase [Candidatus Polarisedimenticolaceae bacterium]